MNTCKTTIKGSGPDLEACLDLPDVAGLFPGVVLCHPHPLFGGDMQNNVIMALSREITACGMAALRFNFRGVGASRGSFADGVGEVEDALMALSFLAEQKNMDAGRIGIAGYSFGGMVAISAGNISGLARAIALVSPVMPDNTLAECTKPKYIITGSGDRIVSPASVKQGVEGMAAPKKIDIIEGVDHFWSGQLQLMGKNVACFLYESLTFK